MTTTPTDNPPFVRTTLANGLRVLIHEDHSAPLVAINVLYHVGSKNETAGGRGFAHLFEHLMFDGSKHVERGGYDAWCTSVGGENNAFTTPDITNYYLMLPSNQLALGLWLEADRMAEFAVADISLQTQKKVVLEEKQQVMDDAPYGDMMSAMRELAYAPEHPYSWETIGVAEDIARATMDDVRGFYQRFYRPSNATLVVAGDIVPEAAMELVEGYFGDLPMAQRPLGPSVDPSMLHHGRARTIRNSSSPLNSVFLGFHLPSIHHPDMHALDLLAAVLADGESSRLYRHLEYEQGIASETEAFVDEGELGSLFYLYAVARNNRYRPRRLRHALIEQIEAIATHGVEEQELAKVKNQKLTRIAISLQAISSRAERLAWFDATFGRPELAFAEAELFEHITADDLQRVAATYLLGQQPCEVAYVQR